LTRRSSRCRKLVQFSRPLPRLDRRKCFSRVIAIANTVDSPVSRWSLLLMHGLSGRWPNRPSFWRIAQLIDDDGSRLLS
jgi:hypothetical protein